MTLRSLGNAGLDPSRSPLDAVSSVLNALRRPAELWLLVGLLICYILAYALDLPELHRSMNVAGPVMLSIILGWSCYRIVQSAIIALWAPLFWFRLACAVYFGFGALAPHIANEETRSSIYGLYYFSDASNFKVNLIYATGIFCVLAFSNIFLYLRIRAVPHDLVGRSDSAGPDSTRFFAFGFLLFGGILRYGLILPYMFGLTNTVLPGMLITLAKSYYAGIYLLIVYAVINSRGYLLFALVLVSIEIVFSISSFAKTELILILIFTLLGFVSAKANKLTFIVGVCSIIFVYVTFQPLVEHGRNQLLLRYGEITNAGIIERWDIASTWMNGEREKSDETRQTWLLRLSYVNVNAFVVDQYDSGIPGHTFVDAAAVFVPRVLWPNKPVITALGEDLNFLVSRRIGSQLGVGHFGEAYWNFGWAGFIPFMGVLALILSVFTWVSMDIMARRDWLLLPFVLLGVNIGLRVDGHFVADILGPAWMAFLLRLALVTVKAMPKAWHRENSSLTPYSSKLR
jgi:hypothetical protein